MSKVLMAGIAPSNKFYISFLTKRGKFETIYSQMKIKPHVLYFLVLTKSVSEFSTEITLHVNGQIETQITMGTRFEALSGNFYLGSEYASSYFLGIIQEAVIFVEQALEQQEIKDLYERGIKTVQYQGSFKKTPSPMKINQNSSVRQASGTKMGNTNYVFENATLTASLYLQQTGTNNDDIQEQQQQQENTVELTPAQKFNKLVERVKEVIQNTKQLGEKCQEFAVNFENTFLTLSMLSPVIQEGVPARIPFNCLHQHISDNFSQEASGTMYAIEFQRFLKAMNTIGCRIYQSEFFELAKACNAIKKHPELGQYILYDRLLLAIRNAVLSKEEIRFLRKSYKANPLQTEEEMHTSPEQQEKIEQAIQIGPLALGYFASENLSAGFDTLSGFKEKSTTMQYYPAKIMYYITKQNQIPFKIQFVFRNFFASAPDQFIQISDPESEMSQEFYLNEHIVAADDVDPDQLLEFSIEFTETEVIKSLVLNFDQQKKLLVSLTFTLPQGNRTLFLVPSDFFSSQAGIFSITLNFNPDEYISNFYGSCLQVEVPQIENSVKFLAGFGGYVIKDVYYQELMTKLQLIEEENNNVEELPELSENWAQGRIMMVINHCANCQKHMTTSWHQEADFVEKFNSLGNDLKELFPNLEIIGNYDDPGNKMEHFDVYLRGLGDITQRDIEGRYWLYQKHMDRRLFFDIFQKEMLKVYDRLIMLIAAHGDTLQLQKSQETFFTRFANQIPRKFQHSHEHPTNIPERIIKESKQQQSISAGTPMICKHWGCGKTYNYSDSPGGRDLCKHHPGVYQFGSIQVFQWFIQLQQGLWPESWTCCRKSWESEGCTLGKHKGVPVASNWLLCVNRGELNPNTKRPDSACGASFIEGSDSQCKFHTGYLVKAGSEWKWSCCDGYDGCEPCNITEHQAAKWPDEAARLYFVQKDALEQKPRLFSQTALTSGVYFEAKPYEIAERKRNQKKQNKNQGIVQIGDVKKLIKRSIIKSINNVIAIPAHETLDIQELLQPKQRMLQIHKSIKILQLYLFQSKDIIWMPHWTCCRKEWTSKGCSKTYHKGPLVEEMTPETHPYRWPSEHAQKYFHKVPSSFWLGKLAQLNLTDPETVNLHWKKCMKELAGPVSTYQLTTLVDKFFLHLYVNSDDLSFHFKFMDVINGEAENQLSDASGNVDKEKFIKWWLADLDTIRPKS